MKLLPIFLSIVAVLEFAACSTRSQRGIADRRSDFGAFLPMKQDPHRDGLRAVRPHFKKANREEILSAIERACSEGKAGSSVLNPRTGDGYYVNCNPRNRQLLNGYVSVDPTKRPHSRP
jgi:hypothetical protein